MLYFLRHGQTDFNTKNFYMGALDIPLNKKGVEQAKILSESVESLELNLIISSDLSRAKQTANIISETYKLPLLLATTLRERQLGSLEGLYKADDTNLEQYNVEEILKFQTRVLETIYSLKQVSDLMNILIVSHSHVFKVLANCANVIVEKEKLLNCEYSSIKFIS